MTALNFATLLPLMSQLGTYLQSAGDYYLLMSKAGDVDPDIIAAFLQEKMKNWDPVVGGKSFLDDETRRAGARFLAGISINMAKQK